MTHRANVAFQASMNPNFVAELIAEAVRDAYTEDGDDYYLGQILITFEYEPKPGRTPS